MISLNPNNIEGKIGVAVSGGIDSMCLLDMYARAKIDIVAINVEHGLRGKESIEDTEFVKKRCAERGIPCIAESTDAKRGALRGESAETCARRLRYEIFERLLDERAVDAIALAHHADDNAETVLMRIFRGTGLRGLAGIRERPRYIRPLLGISRRDIEEYAKKWGVPHVEDRTNRCEDFARNYIRHTILPAAERKYPNAAGALNRLARTAGKADELLRSLCVAPERRNGETYIPRLFDQPEILQEYSIMRAISDLGISQDFEARHAECVLRMRDMPNNAHIDLPFGLVCVRRDDGAVISRKNDEGFEDRAFGLGETYRFRGFAYSFEECREIGAGDTFDPAKLPNGCLVRRRRNGDEFRRANGRAKLLSDFLNEKKLARSEKDALLTIAKGSIVYAALGLEIGDVVKITPETTKMYRIKKEKDE